MPRVTSTASAHAAGVPGAYARSRAEHAPELTLLTRVREPAVSLFAPPRSLLLGAPAAALPVALAVGTFTTAQRSARSDPSPHHAHSHSARHAQPPPTGVPDKRHGPFAPFGPTGPGTFAAVASGPSGGAAFVLWSALLLGFVICAARTLRRHTLAPVVFTPTAFVSLLQRPG